MCDESLLVILCYCWLLLPLNSQTICAFFFLAILVCIYWVYKQVSDLFTSTSSVSLLVFYSIRQYMFFEGQMSSLYNCYSHIYSKRELNKSYFHHIENGEFRNRICGKFYLNFFFFVMKSAKFYRGSLPRPQFIEYNMWLYQFQDGGSGDGGVRDK